ncbi:MAG: FliI/YscN family ATPase [Phycisphaerae bacterium]|jgi:FliI/YscN family ATPase
MTLLEPYEQMLQRIQPLGVSGRVNSVRGLTVSVSDFPAPIGASCRLVGASCSVEGRVVGFAGEETLVMPMGTMAGICRGHRVLLTGTHQMVPVGEGMLGRVLNGAGQPIDGLGPITAGRGMPIWPDPIAPMRRRRISEVLSTGVRCIDALLTVGRGQRMGIFSGSGVGKSVLLGMISRHTAADVAVIALIGERGREVRDFIEKDLGAEGLKKAVVIASTGDEPPLVRVQAGAVASAVAEYFRDRGCNVVLLMDSLTRLATAQRQIGLVAGEPPTTKGYTPSVFNLLPQLLERCGRTESGSITGFYTVLAEGDDASEPISDAVRAVTDGHIHLSRGLAKGGHYPAIDCLQSVSRVMIDLVEPEHLAASRELVRVMALYDEIEDMVTIGAYQAGANADYDLALVAMPMIRAFLRQGINEADGLEKTIATLLDLHRQLARMKAELEGRSRSTTAEQRT